MKKLLTLPSFEEQITHQGQANLKWLENTINGLTGIRDALTKNNVDVFKANAITYLDVLTSPDNQPTDNKPNLNIPKYDPTILNRMNISKLVSKYMIEYYTKKLLLNINQENSIVNSEIVTALGVSKEVMNNHLSINLKSESNSHEHLNGKLFVLVENMYPDSFGDNIDGITYKELGYTKDNVYKMVNTCVEAATVHTIAINTLLKVVDIINTKQDKYMEDNEQVITLISNVNTASSAVKAIFELIAQTENYLLLILSSIVK